MIMMKKSKWKKLWIVALTAILAVGSLTVSAGAAGESAQSPEKVVLNTPYLSLGADLDQDQRASVLVQLQITEEELQGYRVVTTTNQEEHQYLDAYLDYSLIGDQALSSAMVTGKESGYGIQVTTTNISYCTVGMYQNALATAGIKNADIKVAAPYKMSGTAALIGVMKAYSEMTGEPLRAESVDAATQELVTTSQMGESLGDTDQAEELIAAVKEAIVSEGLNDPDKIKEVIEKACSQLNISLTEEEKQKIQELMQKIAGLDLDMDSIKEQVKGIYEKLKGMDLNLSQEQVEGFLAKIGQWLSNLWNSISRWFSGIVGS